MKALLSKTVDFQIVLLSQVRAKDQQDARPSSHYT